MATDNPDFSAEQVIGNTTSSPGIIQASKGEFAAGLNSGSVHMSSTLTYQLLPPNNPPYMRTVNVSFTNNDPTGWVVVILFLNASPNAILGTYWLAPWTQNGCIGTDHFLFPDGFQFSSSLCAAVQYTQQAGAPSVDVQTLVSGVANAASIVPATH